jgi:hypothetical protein
MYLDGYSEESLEDVIVASLSRERGGGVAGSSVHDMTRNCAVVLENKFSHNSNT